MADAVLLDVVIQTLMWIGIIVAIIIPWIMFFMACFLNKQIWYEVAGLLDKNSVRVVEFMLNGQVSMALKKMGKDKKIVLHKNKEGDPSMDDILNPSLPGNFESGGRRVFCKIQGQDNNFNPVQMINEVTDPLRQMFGSMRFEEGRRYERRFFPQPGKPDMFILLLFVGAIIGLIVVGALVAAGNNTSQEALNLLKDAAKPVVPIAISFLR